MAAENRTSRAGRAGGADLRNHPRMRADTCEHGAKLKNDCRQCAPAASIHPTVVKLAEELAEVADETLTSEGSHKAYEAEMAKLRHEFELRLQLFLEACRRSFDVG